MAAQFDVVIIGGGLVGACLACALAPLGYRVALVEAVSQQTSSEPGYDDRTLALSASSCRILEGLGMWPEVRVNATPIREIQVREYQRPGRVILKPGELGLDRFGHVVEARIFGTAVLEHVSMLENLHLFCPAQVTEIDVGETGASLVFSDDSGQQQLTAQLLVGADGARSLVRDSLGIATDTHDYGQTAIVCNITPEHDHGGRAFECFTPSGPFAVMPHVAGRCGLIWCAESGQADALMELPPRAFLEQARQRFGNYLGRFLKVGKRSSYPLRLVRALEDTHGRAVILGNAAHAIHPVGAQGFNLGLRDVALLAELLADARRTASVSGSATDAGDATLLQRYSTLRREDHAGTIAYSDGLARIFSNAHPLVETARTLGLLAHAFVPSLRRQLAVRAMGYRGYIPRLAAGEPL